MNKSVPFFDYPRLFKDEEGPLLDLITEVGRRGAFIMQEDLRKFEVNLAKYTKSSFAIGVANGTDALELALTAVGLSRGDEVICCSHTMLATASAIKLVGGTPIPVELGDDNLIDPDAVADAINDKTVGIMPTQLNGRTCDMDKLNAIAEQNGLFIVEDAAQGLGSKFKGKCAGTFGIAGTISFFPAKVLGCLGDAGAVLTDDVHVKQKVFQLHDHGRDETGEVKSWGRNSRLDNMQAAILDRKLRTYSSVVERRRQIACIYQERLEHLEEVKLPPAPDSDPLHYDVYQNYEITAAKRDFLKAHLYEMGIGTLIQWGGKGLHHFKELGFTVHLPKTDYFFEHCIMLPMNTFLSDEDVHYVCDHVIGFYRK